MKFPKFSGALQAAIGAERGVYDGLGVEHGGWTRLKAGCCGYDRIGRLPLGKWIFGEVAAWENAFGKSPNLNGNDDNRNNLKINI